MNIKNFKEGDIITRNEPMKYSHDGIEDGSYLGDRLIFRGHDETSKVIFFELAYPFEGDLHDLSYGRDRWDEGWCLYPETMWQKIKKVVKK